MNSCGALIGESIAVERNRIACNAETARTDGEVTQTIDRFAITVLQTLHSEMERFYPEDERKSMLGQERSFQDRVGTWRDRHWLRVAWLIGDW